MAYQAEVEHTDCSRISKEIQRAFEEDETHTVTVRPRHTISAVSVTERARYDARSRVAAPLV